LCCPSEKEVFLAQRLLFLFALRPAQSPNAPSTTAQLSGGPPGNRLLARFRRGLECRFPRLEEQRSIAASEQGLLSGQTKVFWVNHPGGIITDNLRWGKKILDRPEFVT
jgi:hypothetical protein